jgi:hypothetical protein
MLQQLADLSLTAEGRYATTQELQFVRNYVASVDLRLSAYQKIRDGEEEIINQLEAKMLKIQADIFQLSSGDVSSFYQRDTKSILRKAISAMLSDDLDRLQEHVLLWHRTIIKAVGVKHVAEMTYKTMPEVIKQFLTPQEFALVEPILQLNQAVLTA